MLELMLPRIKVCGLTRLEDLRAAVEAGVEAVGFVLHEASPRGVHPLAALRMVFQLPSWVLPVAVVVGLPPEEAALRARGAGARAVQLCGQEDPGAFRDFELPVLRRIPVQEDGARELEAWRGIAAGFVLDHPAAPGGTGAAVDRDLAAGLAAQAPCLLAGGLGPENVAGAVGAVHPHGVDASSRLEIEPGRKDHARLRAFVQAARSVLEKRPG